ncbi:MAG: hypothetical protein ABI574_08505 [Burkholderiales bacterium]
MSKGQHGNKEAKKPKAKPAPPETLAVTPMAATPGSGAGQQARAKKK